MVGVEIIRPPQLRLLYSSGSGLILLDTRIFEHIERPFLQKWRVEKTKGKGHYPVPCSNKEK